MHLVWLMITPLEDLQCLFLSSTCQEIGQELICHVTRKSHVSKVVFQKIETFNLLETKNKYYCIINIQYQYTTTTNYCTITVVSKRNFKVSKTFKEAQKTPTLESRLSGCFQGNCHPFAFPRSQNLICVQWEARWICFLPVSDQDKLGCNLRAHQEHPRCVIFLYPSNVASLFTKKTKHIFWVQLPDIEE